MAISTQHNETKFGIGDTVRVHLRVNEQSKDKKSRVQVFEGMVIAIKGVGSRKSFTVRRIGSQKIGIEQIFPISAPTVEKVEVAREGMRGSRHAKLYFTRNKSKREIEKIYSRSKRITAAKEALKTKKKVVKKVSKKVAKVKKK